MRTHVLVAAMLAALSFGYCASAANTPESATTSYKGLWISTPYPSVGVAANESVELDLTLRNAGMPQRVALAAAGLPEKWHFSGHQRELGCTGRNGSICVLTGYGGR
ncbi:MAG TPA: hypothetical protein VLB05_14165 [Dongiaceae bacterium]|nr:hypothetical protein [Dongiaceae bacterium]